MKLETEETIRQTVWNVVHATPILDIHTHIYDVRFKSLLLRGIDELLTYHYLVAETFRYAPLGGPESRELTPDDFYDLSKQGQADWVWQLVFRENSPVSEAARGVLTSLGLAGLDVASRDLAAFRTFYDGLSAEEHIDMIFRAANLEGVVMTNDPFDDEERPIWEGEEAGDPRFRAALRLDGLINDWKNGRERLRTWGYDVKNAIGKETTQGVKNFLNNWIDRMDPVYLAVSLPPDFDIDDKSTRSKLIQKCVLPVCRDRNLPFALMIGVKKLVNPELRLAGDAVGKADIDVVETLCADYPENRFLVTMLSRENQHELCIAARKFGNLMPFGCWWFLNDPMTVDEMTRMRTELLGLSYIPQHSDARVLDQLSYKWAHSRWLIGHVLMDKYCDLNRTGWGVTEEEIVRDVANLFGGAFRRFCEF